MVAPCSFLPRKKASSTLIPSTSTPARIDSSTKRPPPRRERLRDSETAAAPFCLMPQGRRCTLPRSAAAVDRSTAAVTAAAAAAAGSMARGC
uniref:Uncharacterized protein n=1 Tax=Oryza nivara TaxID=4536 RepID=A0A0E0G1X2_ORYNI